jgi:Leucine-rich repeat (LRR) protein
MNDSLETIAQISSLRELRISENVLTGELSSCLCSLTQLEVLEVQGNKLCDLPEELSALTHLRTLNVSNNQLASLPILALSRVPLVTLIATKNQITGALFTDSDCIMSRLQTLDVSVNSLTAFSTGLVSLPSLRELNISFNRITELQNMSSWTSLINLYAEANKLSSLPEGFTTISTLVHVDLTSNDLPRLDPRLGSMEKLQTFKIAANPIRERKFLTMGTAELKRDLKARLGLDEPGKEVD